MVERSDDAVTSDIDSDLAGPTLLGKRYTDDEETVEILCTACGDGQLSIGAVPLRVKATKPLPSSD